MLSVNDGFTLVVDPFEAGAVLLLWAFLLLLLMFLHWEEVTARSSACKAGRGKELTRDELIFA